MALTESKLIEIINLACPDVERITGWNICTKSTKVKLVQKNEYKTHLTNMLIKENINPIECVDICEVENKLAHYFLRDNTFYFFPDNLGDDANDEWLSVLSAHELAHKGQFSNNPHFAKNYLDLKRICHLFFYEQKNIVGKYLANAVLLCKKHDDFMEAHADYVESEFELQKYGMQSYKYETKTVKSVRDLKNLFGNERINNTFGELAWSADTLFSEIKKIQKTTHPDSM